jgi:hypothetical protein
VAVSAALFGVVFLARIAPEARQRQMVPVAASSIVLTPDTYVGELVTMMGVVEANLTATTFSVDQKAGEAMPQQVLVIAPTLQKPVDPDTYVTVVGEVIRFDAAEIARRVGDYTLDLPADVMARFQGQPVILATSVVDTALEDLAKVPPPPLTPEEEAFDGVMKQVNEANGIVRKGLEGESGSLARQGTNVLKVAFTDAEAFFKDRGNDDAVAWAQEARAAVESIDAAIEGEDWAAATAAVGEMSQRCSACHAAYRVRIDDGSYRVKPKEGGGLASSR